MKVVSERLVSRARACISSVGKTARVGEDGELVALKRALGEDIDLREVEGDVCGRRRRETDGSAELTWKAPRTMVWLDRNGANLLHASSS